MITTIQVPRSNSQRKTQRQQQREFERAHPTCAKAQKLRKQIFRIQRQAQQVQEAATAFCERLEGEIEASSPKSWRPPECPSNILPRTRQRLTDATEAYDRGEFTVCMVLLRVAIDTAAREIVGVIELRPFARMIAITIVGKRKANRVCSLLGDINGIIHGNREATQHEASRALRLIRVIGGRWCQRVFGDIVPPDMPVAVAATDIPTNEVRQ